jgi:hypothetical protein
MFCLLRVWTRTNSVTKTPIALDIYSLLGIITDTYFFFPALRLHVRPAGSSEANYHNRSIDGAVVVDFAAVV